MAQHLDLSPVIYSHPVTESVYPNVMVSGGGGSGGTAEFVSGPHQHMVTAGAGIYSSSITMVTSSQGHLGPVQYTPVNAFRFLGPEALFQSLIAGVLLMMKRADIRSIRLPVEQIRSALMEQAGEGYKVGALGGGPRVFGESGQHLIGLEPSETVWVEESLVDQTVLVKIVHEHDRIYREGQ